MCIVVIAVGKHCVDFHGLHVSKIVLVSFGMSLGAAPGSPAISPGGCRPPDHRFSVGCVVNKVARCEPPAAHVLLAW